jgi:signal transduction histidine kinase
LHSFRRVVGNTEANILLKPVTRPILTAYLALAVNSHEECVSSADSLRADRDEMLQCLIQANLRLQEYDQERTNFLVRAIHDFRASLTALSGYCGLLLSEALGELTSDQGETIRRMQHSTNRLSRMANGMFELGISRRVQRSPDFRRADLHDCLKQANHEIAPFARDKNITIDTDVGPPPPNLYFDPCQVEQVLINLLDNACKFTPRGGFIEIKGYPHFMDRRDSRQVTPTLVERRSRVSTEPNAFRIDIRDSGSRIQPDQLQQIFEEYTSSGGKQDRSGGGLGLAICRFIVEQHGGRIWAENTEAGPLFSFTLPLRSGYHADLESGLASPRGSNSRL